MIKYTLDKNRWHWNKAKWTRQRCLRKQWTVVFKNDFKWHELCQVNKGTFRANQQHYWQWFAWSLCHSSSEESFSFRADSRQCLILFQTLILGVNRVCGWIFLSRMWLRGISCLRGLWDVFNFSTKMIRVTPGQLSTLLKMNAGNINQIQES